jgi:glycine/D-amino acid oxidase-like deaminating enzyme
VVTKSKDLRTGRSIWQDRRAPQVPHGLLRRDLETDVLIVGAGITGAMIADALTRAGLKVVIVDRRGPAKGSTTASTALVQYEIDVPLIKLARRIGKANACRAWRRSRLAIEALAARLGELRLSSLVRRDTLYLAGNLLNPEGLARECQARQATGLACRMLERRELREQFGIRGKAALMGYGDLEIDPREATCALLSSATSRGAKLLSPVDIVDVSPGRRIITATAKSGRRIRAHHLVLATGYEFPDMVPRRGHRILSTWAIATVPQRRNLWPGECMIWESADPYLYVRTTADGRVICGGEDEPFSDEAARDALLPRKTATLRRKLGKLLPGLSTDISHAWTGSFGESSTGLPSIGAVPGMRNCWAALGYGGNGTTYAQIAADVIAGALARRPDIDADLYDFPRQRG